MPLGTAQAVYPVRCCARQIKILCEIGSLWFEPPFSSHALFFESRSTSVTWRGTHAVNDRKW